MPSLTNRKNSPFIKLMMIGDSGTGKTGSLTSLVKAGYNLRILDMDNGLDSLVGHMGHENLPFDKVSYVTYHDKFKATQTGFIVDGAPKAYPAALKALTKWPDDESRPSEWGPDTVFVLDSLTAFGRSAFLWAKGMNPGAKDPRQWYFTAQESVSMVLEMLMSAEFQTNIIILSHIQYMELADGTAKGYATSIGKALGPQIPKFFNSLLLAESKGSGDNVRRTIRTVPTNLVDAKNPRPFAVEKTLPLASGLATFFEQMKA